MSATKKDNNIFGVDVKSIIKDSLKTQTKDIVAESDLLEEAYVHEPKQFKQRWLMLSFTKDILIPSISHQQNLILSTDLHPIQDILIIVPLS